MAVGMVRLCQKPDREGGLGKKRSLAYARASDTLISVSHAGRRGIIELLRLLGIHPFQNRIL